MQATARSFANIAFIKYWGNADDDLRLPANSSISMNLDGLYAETTVQWDKSFFGDGLTLNGQPASPEALKRVSHHLDRIRRATQTSLHAQVISENNFPMGVGIASSAAAFAALTHAAVHALGIQMSEQALTRLARQGSGSASRSIPTGFVVWYAGDNDEASYAESIAPPDHWDLVDVIAIVSDQHKAVGSQKGHTTAQTSDLQIARVSGAQQRLDSVIQAIHERNFPVFAEVVEHDSNLMHAVMMTSRPPLFYWQPATLTLMNAVRSWRAEGIDVCYTLDAGPNVHCICTPSHADKVRSRLMDMEGVQDVRIANVGGASKIIA